MPRFLTLSIIMIVILTACSFTEAVPPAKVLTSTPFPASNLFTPTASSQSIRFQCLQILPTKPRNLEISGQIVLRDYQVNGTLFALDVLNGRKTEIFRSSGPRIIAAVSPDRQLLAYRDNGSTSKGDKLVIVDSSFVEQQLIPWQSGWLRIVNWINNKQLALLNNNPETKMVIFNWITRQEKPISFNQFPDYSNSVRHSWMEFDPTMQRVLYPIIGSEYSLFDLTYSESIAKLSSWVTEVPDASWTTDGDAVAVTGPSPKYYNNLGGSDEIFEISRNGQIEQMTHLADYYGRGLGLYSPRWSPDEKQLAFWVQHEASGTLDHVLTIVDTTTKTATNFCISSNPSGYGGELYYESLPAPIWSPDGKQIVVEDRFSDDHNRVILADLSNMIAVEVAQDTRPVGWMESKP